MIKSRPYKPKAKGKVEHSHRVLGKKIYYDMIKMKKSGVNWVKNIQMHMKYLNNGQKGRTWLEKPFPSVPWTKKK